MLKWFLKVYLNRTTLLALFSIFILLELFIESFLETIFVFKDSLMFGVISFSSFGSYGYLSKTSYHPVAIYLSPLNGGLPLCICVNVAGQIKKSPFLGLYLFL